MAPASPTRAWITLAALSLLFFHITAATFTSLGVVLPAMVSELHWSWGDAGLGFTLLAVACGLASLAPALVIRLLGVRAALLLGGVVLAAGLLLFATAHGVAGYLLGAVLAGVGFALAAIIPGTFVLARAFPNPSLAFGLYFTVGGLGGAAGPILAHFGVQTDWRGYWFAAAAISVILAALAAASVASRWAQAEERLDPDQPPAEGWSVAEALRTPQFWIVTFAYTAYLLLGVTVNYASVEHLTERGFAPATAAALLSAENLLNAMSRAAGGWAGSRVDARKLTMIGLVALPIGAVALSLAHGSGLAALYVAGSGIGYGLAYLATPVLLLAYFGRRRNLELFSLMCLISTAAAVGPWLAGVSHDKTGGFSPALWGFAAVALVALGAVALMKPPVRRTSA